MRLINLRSTSQENAHPCVVMALGDLGDGSGCYHYRTTKDNGSSMSLDGLELILAKVENGDSGPDGVTIDSLLAICEDHAKQLGTTNPAYRLVATQLLAARRALATDHGSRNMYHPQDGDVAVPERPTTATVERTGQGDFH